MIETYSDRSTCVTMQKCPRLRWWTHEFPNPTAESQEEYLQHIININAPGVVPNKLNIDTTLGSAFHVGVYHLLNGVGLDEAVGRVLEGDSNGWAGYWPMVRGQELELGDKEDTGYVYYEQAALAEALVRGYYYYALPRLLDTYEVLETEYDEQAYFSDPSVLDFRLRWGIRTDGLLRDRSTDALFVLSLKTSKEWKRNTEENNRTDMQGLTEMGAVEQRLGRWQAICDGLRIESNNPPLLDPPKGPGFDWKERLDFGLHGIPRWFWDRYKDGGDPVIAGVKMEFAMKGYRSEYPKGSGQYKYSNPLIRPYKRADDIQVKRRANAGNVVSGEYAIQWDFKDFGGMNHTLGKGWRVTNIWEDMGVKNWIEYCMEHEIQGFQPGYALEKQFTLPVEYTRNPDDVKRKIRQVVNQEWRVHQGREATLQALFNEPEKYIEQLDIHFPQQQDFPHSCGWCSHKIVCLGPDSYKFNPLSHPGFIPRTSNHRKSELIQIGD